MHAARRPARSTPRLSRLGSALLLVLLCQLAACGGRTTTPVAYRGGYSPSSGSYEPPGGAVDPWGPYIREASARFAVPERWIREVMRQESGGQQYLHGQLTTSSAGAMGLMQVMPQTYEGLRQRYGLGSDPYDPHDNIMAGAAYIREMYDRFGAPMFLAAYNAGPNRVDGYLAGGGRLPYETENYLASVAPLLGESAAPAAPAEVRYAEAEPPAARAAVVVTPVASAAPVEVRYAEAEPPLARAAVVVTPVAPPPVTPPLVLAAAAAPASAACDPNAAYDPDRTCPQETASFPPAIVDPAAYEPDYLPAPRYVPPPALLRRVQPAPALLPVPPVPPPRLQLASVTAAGAPFASGLWSIQVGAFRTPAQARLIAQAAQTAVRDVLGAARVEVPSTTPFGNTVLYRARLAGVSSGAAARACSRLGEHGMPCMVVPPGQGS